MARKNRQDFIIGIDEVGRGPLAGPVTVAALMMPKNLRIRRLTKGGSRATASLPPKGLKLKDSKKLSAQQRERWFFYIKRKVSINFAVFSVPAQVIDKINISKASNLAATRALSKLMLKNNLKKAIVLLDGGLYLNKNIRINQRFNPYKSAFTITKGDEKRNCIKLASIAAKVLRDRYMIRMDKKYPQYGFYRHKGYGTSYHFRMIARHGVSKIHRLTFLRKYLKLKKEFKI